MSSIAAAARTLTDDSPQLLLRGYRFGDRIWSRVRAGARSAPMGLLGDPTVPGWITPAVPLLMAYCATFPEGPERVHALIAFQLMLGVLSIALGATGMARKVFLYVPAAMKSGIIVGAGFSAVIAVFQVNGKFDESTRAAIARWQEEHGYPTTGFLNAAQHKVLTDAAAEARKSDRQDRRRAGRGTRYSRGVGGPIGAVGGAVRGVVGGVGGVVGGLFRR